MQLKAKQASYNAWCGLKNAPHTTSWCTLVADNSTYPLTKVLGDLKSNQSKGYTMALPFD